MASITSTPDAGEHRARVDVGDDVADHGRHDDGDAAHRGRARLGDVPVGHVLVDGLADAVGLEPVDQVAGAEQGGHEAEAAGDEEGNHGWSRTFRGAAGPRDGADDGGAGERLSRHHPVVERDSAGRRPSGWSRGPCRRPRRRRRGGRRPPPARWRRAGRARPRPAAPAGTPARISSMIARGSSERGLSEVRIDPVGEPGRHLPHDRALGAVAVAAAAEHDGQPARPRDQLAGGGERLLERVGLVGVVDQHRERLAGVDGLEPAGHRRGLRQPSRRCRPGRGRRPAATVAAPTALRTLNRPASASVTSLARASGTWPRTASARGRLASARE